MKPISILFVQLSGVTYSEMEGQLLDKEESFDTAYNKEGKSLPLGVLYLSACLEEKFKTNVNQSIVDYVEELDELDSYRSVDDFIEGIAVKGVSSDPDIIAISLMFTTSYKFFKQLVKIYRTLWPNATFIVGGVYATVVAEYILQKNEIDYVFRGESEVALMEFMDSFMGDGGQSIQGVYSKKDIGTGFCDICQLPDLNELPYPNWGLINFPVYVKANKTLKRYGDDEVKITEMMGSRGCPYKCTFCAGSVSMNHRKFRKRSVENILGEATELYKRYGVTSFIFMDDMQFINEKRFLEFEEAFKSMDIQNFDFQNQGFHCNTTTLKMIDSVSETVSSILFALDSASQYVQNEIILKKIKLERAKELVSYSRSKGLITRVNVIFGFPNETKEMMREGADYMRTLQADWFIILTAIPFVGSELFNQFAEMGAVNHNDEDLWENSAYCERFFDTDTCTADELKNFTYKLNLDLNFINNYNLKVGNYARAISLFEERLQAYPNHTFGLIALHKAYEGLGDVDQCNNIKSRLYRTISESESARQMHEVHRDLLVGTEFYDLPAM